MKHILPAKGALPGILNQLSQIKPYLRSTITSLGDFILPPVCLNCLEPLAASNSLCADCWQNISFISTPYCQITGQPLPYDCGPEALSLSAIAAPPHYDKARSTALYKGTMRSLIHKLKYQDKHELTTLLARWLLTTGHELLPECDMLIPIPLYRWRLWQRRFNQSALLAARLSQLSGKPCNHTILTRPKKTRQQVGLNEKQRKNNLQGAFKIDRHHLPYLEGKTILLIDDVITTGATANAAASALKKAGCNQVYLLSLASVVISPTI